MFCCTGQNKPKKNGESIKRDESQIEDQKQIIENVLSHNQKVIETNQQHIEQNEQNEQDEVQNQDKIIKDSLEQYDILQSDLLRRMDSEIGEHRVASVIPNISKFMNPFKDLNNQVYIQIQQAHNSKSNYDRNNNIDEEIILLPSHKPKSQSLNQLNQQYDSEQQQQQQQQQQQKSNGTQLKQFKFSQTDFLNYEEKLFDKKIDDKQDPIKISKINEKLMDHQKENISIHKIQSLEQNEIKENSMILDDNNNDDENDDDDKELTEQEAKRAALYRWAKDQYEYCQDKNYDEIMNRVSQFNYLEKNDEARTSDANKDGGKQCLNKRMVKTIRAIGKQVIKEIGKQVLSGNFNLSSVPFPIRAMIPKSALEKALQATCLFPLYINRAALLSDPVERLKFVICATIGNFYINCSFLKPLNPILGETIEAQYSDGTQLYAEQILHHPPVSYFMVVGPNKSYRFYGNYNYEANAGLNSLSLKNKGKRYIQFQDGQLIEYNFASEEYCGSFWGTMKLEAKGKMIFTDRENHISAEMEFDNVRWKPTDYFQGEIKVNGSRVSKIYGSYMGFIQFDNIRYWDFRDIQPYSFKLIQPHPFLQSDHQFRKDRQFLLKKKVDEAQIEKQNLENLQRCDAKIRKQFKQKSDKQKQ